MEIQLEEVLEEGTVILPACKIEGNIVGIYTDVKKTNLILKQLKGKGFVQAVMNRLLKAAGFAVLEL